MGARRAAGLAFGLGLLGLAIGETALAEGSPVSVAPVDPMAQVRPVAALADVEPTDWAYQAVRSLVERYGLRGYEDGTFRGDRALSRAEFAAAIARVLEQLQVLAQTTREQQVEPEDLATLRFLQTEYADALDNLGVRLDRNEQRTTLLEERQFSATTKLEAQAVLASTLSTDANLSAIARVRLNLQTELGDRSRLLTQLETGNGGRDAADLAHQQGGNWLGTRGFLAGGGGLDYIDAGPELRLSQLHYTLRPTNNLALTVGPKLAPRDFIDANALANDSSRDFSSSVFVNNPLIVQNAVDRPGGAGAAIAWSPSSQWTLRGLHVWLEDEQVDEESLGLGGDRRQSSLELEYAPSEAIALRLQYTYANLSDIDINAFGLNAQWRINRSVGVFGRYGIASYEGFSAPLDRSLDLTPQTWAVGLTLQDWLVPGALAGLAVGQPFAGTDLGDATQTNFEAFYNLPLNDRLSVTPVFMLITRPDNDDRPAIWQGTLRTVVTF